MTAVTAPSPPTTDALQVRTLGDRLHRLLRPVRLLEALRWPRSVEVDFFASRCQTLPAITRHTYNPCDLPHHALADLTRRITRQLGSHHPAGRLLLHRCAQARDVFTLLEARGTPAFADVSARLYGRANDATPSLQHLLASFRTPIDEDLALEDRPLDADTCAHLLSARLSAYFTQEPSPLPPVKVIVTDALDATAAVGGSWLKIRRDARFNLRDVRLLEVHEGWVHLGITRNARLHPLGNFLSRAFPSAASTQEGLAVWTEVLTFASHPARLQLLADRVEAIARVEDGADFLDTYRFFRERGQAERDAYHQTVRIFRGSLPDGGPFTKDLAYARGFAEIDQFLRTALTQKRLKQIPFLFCGKVSIAELPDLEELHAMGLLRQPRLVPPPFADLRALAAWLCTTRRHP